MQKSNKRRNRLLIVTAAVAVLLCAWVFSGAWQMTKNGVDLVCQFCQQRSLSGFSTQLFDYPLPPQTEIVETQMVEKRLHYGNGRPNYVALMLVKSDLGLSELTAYYRRATTEMYGTLRLTDFLDTYKESYTVKWDVSAVASPEYKPEYNNRDPFIFPSLAEKEDYTGLYFVSIMY